MARRHRRLLTVASVVGITLLALFWPAWLTPAWPDSFDDQELLVYVLFYALMKSDRGSVMQRRARRIDRFGWSLILFDRVHGAAFFVIAARIMYPEVFGSPWILRVTFAVLIAVTVWNWIEVRMADWQRLDRAVGHRNQRPERSGQRDRRSGHQRRREDRIRDQRLAEFERHGGTAGA